MDQTQPTLVIWPNHNPKRRAWTASIQHPDGSSTMTTSVHTYAEAQQRAECHGYQLQVPQDVYAEMVQAGSVSDTP
jgi:hypothetical protein